MKNLPTLLILAAALSTAARATAAEPVQLNWLGGSPPSVATNVTWGMPWPQGEITRETTFNLTGGDDQTRTVQSWPIAYWADGSVKWTAHALTAPAGLQGPLTLAPGGSAAATSPAINYTEDNDAFIINTGAVVARIPKRDAAIIASLRMGEREVARRGRLVLITEDRSRYEAEGIRRDVLHVGAVESAVLEQRSPGRAVVKLSGRHVQGGHNSRAPWLPFTVRLYFHAGSPQIRMVHSFVFDGQADRDFIKGIGVAFDVPFREEQHNRHYRFVGDGSGVWSQAVRLLPGFRDRAGPQAAELYASHLAGQRVPNVAELTAPARDALQVMPVWGDAKLTQPGAHGFAIHKRTTAASSWVKVTEGRRALGLVSLGDVSGGLAVGVKDFWQKHPSALEIRRAGEDAGEVRAWLWSPEAPPMDLRHYSTMPHGLEINYEDWKPGWSTPHGIANTHELTLWALDAVPDDATLTAMAHTAAAPPMLVATPEYYHSLPVFGRWSLPDRSTPALRWVEDQVEGLINYYQQQVDERAWYGFWDYGDIMHNYDFGRHDWRYDVGGWAWVNTELMPDMLLWYGFLRTGRADWYRFAEAMTRHTSEVDVHHSGPFAPLGSRHNVSHWGDGAKQPRISHAGLKRFLYFLSGGDERLGDLMREQINADLTYAYLVQFNGSHYHPTPDGGYTLAPRASGPAPRPEEFGPYPTAADRKTQERFGIDWMAYAINWTTEWERGGDQSWRTRVEADMRAMLANLGEGGRMPGRHFDMLFGGPENMFVMEPMYDIPEFWDAWANTCEAAGRQVTGNGMTAPRLLAYAAHKKNNAELGRMAWDKLIGDAFKTSPPRPQPVAGPDVIHPLTDPAFLGAAVGWQRHGVASVHWALNAIETMELARPWLEEWEATQR